jgi:hypothetical protein
VAELASIATQAGPNTGLWPGLTIYRFTAPAGPTWEEIQSLSLCIVAQGRKAVTVGGETYMYDPFRYLVLSSHLHFQAEILEATIGRPFLSLVLQIDPDLVRQVSSDMLERRTTVFGRARPRPGPGHPMPASPRWTRSFSGWCRSSCGPSRPPPNGGFLPRSTCRNWSTGCCSATSTRGCSPSPRPSPPATCSATSPADRRGHRPRPGRQIRAGLVPLGCVDDFRVDWQWIPAWRPADITDSGREQLRAIGFTL